MIALEQVRKSLLQRLLCMFFPILVLSNIGNINVQANTGKTENSTDLQQTRKTITGIVVDRSGEPLVGVGVSIPGTTMGTITDVSGKYEITVQGDNQVLNFSYIGFITVNIEAKNNVIDVIMEEDVMMMDEVVVTAMGIKKERKALGYAVQDINSVELQKTKTANPINSLAGKIAGVNVTQTSGGAGAGANIILRGGTSLERDNQPLFVVDGIIYDNSTSVNGNSAFDGAQSTNSTYSNRIMDINPDDIENMSVLKGPAAAALYGSRAAAGVILITTKKGSEGTVSVNFNSRFQSNWANRLPEQQSTYKRGLYQQDGLLLEGDATTTMGSWGAKSGANETIYNNIENFFRPSNTWDNSVSVSGGSKTGSFYFSASNFDEVGIIPESSFDKKTFRFNGEQKYGILRIGANVAYSVSDQLSSLTSGGLYNTNGEGAIQSAYIWPRNLDMKNWLNEDGSKYRLFDWQLVQDDFDNPYWIVNKMPRKDKTKRFTGSVNVGLDITDWWSVNATMGVDRYTTNTTRFTAPGSGISINYQKGLLAENDRAYEYSTSNIMTNFHKRFSDFDLNLLLGTTSEYTSVNYDGRKAWNFIIPEFYVVTNVSNTDLSISQSRMKKRLVGAYGEFRGSYKNFAYLTLTGRNDWTSTLPVNSRSYFYPSVSGSIVFTELMPKSDVLTFGKVRASWARVGKDADAYVTNTYVNPPEHTIYNNGDGLGIRDEYTRGNSTLIPEITESQEYGFDLRLFDSRIGIEYTYYQNKSKNQLLQPRTSQATGFILLTTNAGVITNKGMELSINVVPVRTKDLTWDITINASGNRGTLDELLAGMEVLYVTDVQVGNAKAASFNKGNYMAISGSKWTRSPEGQLVLNPETGMPTYDGLTTHEIGNREPKVFGGINNSIQYKNWNLSFLLDYRIGGHVYNGTNYYMTENGTSLLSADREKLSITGVVQTGENVGADGVRIPVYSEPRTFEYETGKMYTVGNQTVSGEYMINYYYWQTAHKYESANFMTDVNWLRLRNISLSYSFSKNTLDKLKGIKGLTLTATGTNLLLLTNYKGMDPETSAAGSGAVGSSSVGIDFCGIPALAGFSFGLNLTF